MGGGNVTNISKKIRILLCIFLFSALGGFAGALYAQEQTPFAQDTAQRSEPAPSVSKDAEKDLLIASGTAGGTSEPGALPTTGATSTLWLFIRMILVLALVIACIYALVFFLKRGLNPVQTDNPFLKKAVSVNLAPGKWVHVLTMPGYAWLVGVSDAGVNLIGEITDKDLVDQLILEAGKLPQEKPKDFAEIFASFTGVAKQTELMLKKQRGRFENGGRNE